MVGKTDNIPLFEYFSYGVLYFPTGLFVNDVEYCRHRPRHSFTEIPARQFFRHGIHKRDPGFHIGSNDPITDARQSGSPALFALPQHLLRPLEPADVEIDACPTNKLSLFVAYRNAARQDRVPLSIHPTETVLDVPFSASAYAFLPGSNSPLGIFWMEHISPPELRALVLRKPHELQERFACVGISSVPVTHPDAVVDRLANGTVQAFAVI